MKKILSIYVFIPTSDVATHHFERMHRNVYTQNTIIKCVIDLSNLGHYVKRHLWLLFKPLLDGQNMAQEKIIPLFIQTFLSLISSES